MSGSNGEIIRVHENMLNETEKNHVNFLSKPIEEQGCGYMRSCMLQIIHEARNNNNNNNNNNVSSSDMNDLLDLAKIHQDFHESREQNGNDSGLLPPQEFICPISLDIMKDPVSLPENGTLHTFEKESIRKWIQEKGTSPLTRNRVNVHDLIENTSLKVAINTWMDNRVISGLHFNVCDDH